ncbi:MAG: hypothetical protein ACREAA_11115 [Candidatus Polarisedimenticolia bacterium]
MSIERLERLSLVTGGVGLAACLTGAFIAPAAFYPAWLHAFLFWLGIGLGAHAIVMLHNMTGGAWGLAVHRVLDAAARTIPLMALFFLAILPGVRHLYPWADAERVATDHVLEHRSAWLNFPFWLGRAVLCFAIWIGLSWLLARWWRRLESSFSPDLDRRVRVTSAVGLILYALTVSVAMVDWVMSLDALWYSTIFGAVFMVAQALSAMSFAVVVTLLLIRGGRLAPTSPTVSNDLGNLLLAFVMVWMYLSFSQFLIIWSGNLPEEIGWFVDRTSGGWLAVAIAIMLFEFALPFLLLLQRRVKRSGTLLWVALAIGVMRLVDLLWIVQPAFSPGRFSVHPLHLAAVAGIGGVWGFVFLTALRQRPLSPRVVHAPDPAGTPS